MLAIVGEVSAPRAARGELQCMGMTPLRERFSCGIVPLQRLQAD
jgi:hypothetical protein